MSHTNVKSKWVDGNLAFCDKDDAVIFTVDGTNRKLTFPTGSELEAASGATVDLPTGQVDRADLVEDALVAAVPITILSAAGAALLAAETNGSFNIAVGTNTLLVQGEVTDIETETSVGYALVTLPENYVAAGDIKVRLPVSLVKTGAAVNNASSIDVEAYKQASGAVGADICATAAATFAAVDTWYNKDFVVTATGLVAGDKLLLKITAAITDSEAGGGTLRLNIEAPQILCDVKG